MERDWWGRHHAGAGVGVEAPAFIVQRARQLRHTGKEGVDVFGRFHRLEAHQQFRHVEIGAPHVIGHVGVEDRQVARAMARYQHRFGRFMRRDHGIEVAGQRAAGGGAGGADEGVEGFEPFKTCALEGRLRAVCKVAAEGESGRFR